MSATLVGPYHGKAGRVTAVGLLVVTALVAGACVVDARGPEHVDPAAFAWSAPIAAPSTVYIRNTNGSVEVRPSSDGSVHVAAELRWRRGDPKRDVKFQTVTGANGVTICAIWGDGSCSQTDYTVKEHSLTSLFSNHGDATVAFTVSVPTGVRINALTINGSVGVAATAPVVARTVNGTIKVATSVGPVDAETVTGDVDVRMTTLGPEGAVRARTVTGSASAYLPAKFNGAVDVSSTIGRVSTDFAGLAPQGETKHITGTLGSGGRTVDVGTITGSASLRKLNADGTVATP
jgi:hypothetical protein